MLAVLNAASEGEAYGDTVPPASNKANKTMQEAPKYSETNGDTALKSYMPIEDLHSEAFGNTMSIPTIMENQPITEDYILGPGVESDPYTIEEPMEDEDWTLHFEDNKPENENSPSESSYQSANEEL